MNQTKQMKIEDLNDLLEPHYRIKPHNLDLPLCLKAYL